MFERPSGGECVLLVHIDFPATHNSDDLEEFRDLARSSGASVQSVITGMRSAPDAKYFVGSGKAEEIRATCALEQVDLVIFNHNLSPAQERNLERLIKCRVLDRTGLILDIFAQRARTFEGKLQVELAQLNHLSTRLVRGWTHLERQKGGIGLRGPGETQLETDRRLLRLRIKTIHQRLNKVRKQRDQSRRSRRRAAIPTVSIVGYTNAGKSSLFNALTGENLLAVDQLFATLDPTMRKLELPGAGPAVLADTVGFVRHLPHDLVAAFRATLEETRDANLLLHVIDVANPHWRENQQAVNEVLHEIGADKVPTILVFNKIDQLQNCPAGIKKDADSGLQKVWVSAHESLGLNDLKQLMVSSLFGDPIHRSLCLKPSEGKLRASLYALDAVLSERIDEQGNWWLSVRMARKDFAALFPSLKGNA